MSSLLIKNALQLATFDDEGREYSQGGLFAVDGIITQVGPSDHMPQTADTVIDLKGEHVLMPGMVNTHHHMVQSLTRAVPAAQDAELFNWLKTLYPIWARLTGEAVQTSNALAMSELVLSGCTTSSDHFYIYPNDCRLDDSIAAAKQVGLRFHATRGAMSVGESKGGLPPDSVVEDEDAILKDMQRLVETYHDPSRYALLRVALAPCSPFSVSEDLMRESSRMARALGVGLHTHLAESAKDIAYSLEKFSKTPAQYAEGLDWVGPHVWHAHCTCLDAHGVSLFARTQTGIAHCPSSNMRLASGIMPLRAMMDAGVRVGIGVDGSASNDSGHLLAEARMAMLAARVRVDPSTGEPNPAALSARKALRLATRGGAATLNRDDIGQLTPGYAADCIAFDMNHHAYAGALHDPIAALMFCQPQPVSWSVIQGRVIVKNGELQTLELPNLVRSHNRIAHALVTGA